MSFTSALVLFAVIWFMTLMVILPLRLTTQGEAGNVAPGTPSSAPADPQMRRKLRLATMISAVLWIVIAGVILSGAISVRDLDMFSRMGPNPAD